MKVRHKGLRRLVDRNKSSGLPPHLVPRIQRILAALEVATGPADLASLPSLALHPLKGQYRGFWGISVSGNWRIRFRFEGIEAVDVDFVDYH